MGSSTESPRFCFSRQAQAPNMATMDPAELEAALAAVEEFNADLHESGAFRFAGGLHPPSSAKTVDATDGEPEVVDGPSLGRRSTSAASG